MYSQDMYDEEEPEPTPRRDRVVLMRAPRREMSAKPTPARRKRPLGEPAKPREQGA